MRYFIPSKEIFIWNITRLIYNYLSDILIYIYTYKQHMIVIVKIIIIIYHRDHSFIIHSATFFLFGLTYHTLSKSRIPIRRKSEILFDKNLVVI